MATFSSPNPKGSVRIRHHLALVCHSQAFPLLLWSSETNDHFEPIFCRNYVGAILNKTKIIILY